MNLAGTNALANLGLTRQTTEQLAADNERAKFNEARDAPLKQAQAYGDFIKGMPVMGGSNWTSSVPTARPSARWPRRWTARPQSSRSSARSAAQLEPLHAGRW